MVVHFEIDYVFEKVTKNSPHILARMIEPQDFQLTENSTLGGYRVNSCSRLRSIDDKGMPRFDLFSFNLNDKSELINFKKRQRVELVSQ